MLHKGGDETNFAPSNNVRMEWSETSCTHETYLVYSITLQRSTLHRSLYSAVYLLLTISIVNAGFVRLLEGSMTDTLTLAGTVRLTLVAEITMDGGLEACKSKYIPMLGKVL